MKLSNYQIGIVGLGYVGLPLAVEFGKKFKTVGFDIKAKRVRELSRGHDATLEVSSTELRAARLLSYSGDLKSLRHCDVVVVTVPTPIDRYNRPDLAPLEVSSQAIG